MTEENNSLIFRSVTIRNFLSFGNQEQDIVLDTDLMSVVLGENLDAGGDDSRNGAGKSAIIDSLCYALFGRTLRDTSNAMLVNDLVGRGHAMYVRLVFDKGNYSYLVERGEKPAKLLLLRKPRDSEEDFYTRADRKLVFDISLVKKADTTAEIVKLLGYNLPLFSYLVANSSESTPFFKLYEDKRREVTESLFGFTILSERAERLKKIRKTKKDDLIRAETAYSTEFAANQRVEGEIQRMEERSNSWISGQQRGIEELKETIVSLQGFDAEKEIETLNSLSALQASLKDVSARLNEFQHAYSGHERAKKQTETAIEGKNAKLEKVLSKLKDLDDGTCPTCKQHWVADEKYRGNLDEESTDIPVEIEELEANLPQIYKELEGVEGEYGKCEEEQQTIQSQIDALAGIELTFDTPEEAAKASASLGSFQERLVELEAEENPHIDSIEGLRSKAVSEADDSGVKNLRKVVHHFNFMIELLSSKDSFIRRNIINEWLPMLNARIALYLDVLELPHTVEFQADLSVKITRFQNEKQWGNLSKGERGRLIIALNFSFQDIFEFMNYKINLLCVDELLDNGMCPRGAERSVDLLKAMGAESHKRILLITHRDDIAARIDHMMIVRKENDLSKIIEVE